MKKTTIKLHNCALNSREKTKENQPFETWYEESLEDAYKRLFGKAIAEYNFRQTREDRKIKNYLAQVKKSKLLNVAYEMLFSMGTTEEHLDQQACIPVFKQLFENWKTINPNLEIIGAYFHSKEKAPFLRIVYVPVAYNCTRGLMTQTSLGKAFIEMGFQNKGRETAQIQWERAMLEYFKKIVEDHGIVVTGENKEKSENSSSNDKKLIKQVKIAKNRVKESSQYAENLKKEVERLSAEVKTKTELEKKHEDLKKQAAKLEEENS